MSLAQLIQDVPGGLFVEVPLRDWNSALQATRTPADPDDAQTLAELKIGASRAAGHRTVMVSAGHVRLALDNSAVPQPPAPAPEAPAADAESESSSEQPPAE